MPHASNNTANDPYRIDSVQEIDNLLLQLVERGILLRMHGGNANNTVITTLIAIDFEHGSLIIDSAAQQTINQQLIELEHAYFEAVVDQVSIEFYLQPLSETVYEGRPALTAPIPAFIRRLQRRDSFRIKPSSLHPAQCHLNIYNFSAILPIFDISSGGLSMLDERDELKSLSLSKGSLITNNVLLLPGIGNINVDLEVVGQHIHTMPSGVRRNRVGCAFSNLTASEQIRIQNYITQEQRSQIARERGFA